jgi:hypothetical protein
MPNLLDQVPKRFVPPLQQPHPEHAYTHWIREFIIVQGHSCMATPFVFRCEEDVAIQFCEPTDDWNDTCPSLCGSAHPNCPIGSAAAGDTGYPLQSRLREPVWVRFTCDKLSNGLLKPLPEA